MESGELSDARVVIVLGGDGVGEAAAIANRLTAVRNGFADAAKRIADQPALAAVSIDVDAVDDLDSLPAIIDAAEAARVRTVVAFAPSQLDAIGGLLLGRDVTLLCNPDAIERVAALALAVLDDGLVVRDGGAEAARFQRLNDEVARFAATMARLAAGDEADGGVPRSDPFVADRTAGFVAARDLVPAVIRRAIRARRLRDDVFDLAGLFEDPAWDMLLDLFAAELERRRVSVSSLCIAAAVAPTTALRWIGKLIDAGLLDRRPDDFDKRRAFLSLTARASTTMRNYIAALNRAGLAIA